MTFAVVAATFANSFESALASNMAQDQSVVIAD
jgi:hypothetical protein